MLGESFDRALGAVAPDVAEAHGRIALEDRLELVEPAAAAARERATP